MRLTVCIILLFTLLCVTGPAKGQSSPQIGVAPFKDVGFPPSDTIHPASVQTFMVAVLKGEHGLNAVELQSATKTWGRPIQPNTQLLPPVYRTGNWKENRAAPVPTEWREEARKKRLTILVIGVYEETRTGLRYAVEGLEPISGRSLFTLRLQGGAEERLRIEEELAFRIARAITEQDAAKTAMEARRELYQQRLGSEGLTGSSVGADAGFTSLAEKQPTAEDHYENGFSLTRQYEATQDRKYLEGAAEEYRSALALDPTHFRALNNMGTVMHRLERYEDALGYYQRVLEINPTYARAMENAALALQSLGRNGEALSMWRESLRYEDRPEIRKTIEETIAQLEAAGE